MYSMITCSQNAVHIAVEKKGCLLLNDMISNPAIIYESQHLSRALSFIDHNPALYCIVNDECVVCIADFLDFVKCFSPIDSLFIVGIAQEDNIALLQYYCDELLSIEEREKTVLMPVDAELYRELSNNVDNVFLVFGNNLMQSFHYAGGQLYK